MSEQEAALKMFDDAHLRWVRWDEDAFASLVRMSAVVALTLREADATASVDELAQEATLLLHDQAEEELAQTQPHGYSPQTKHSWWQQGATATPPAKPIRPVAPPPPPHPISQATPLPTVGWTLTVAKKAKAQIRAWTLARPRTEWAALGMLERNATTAPDGATRWQGKITELFFNESGGDTGGQTTIDADWHAQLIQELVQDGRGSELANLRAHVHSHHGLGVGHSTTDMSMIGQFLREQTAPQQVLDGEILTLIVGSSGAIEARLACWGRTEAGADPTYGLYDVPIARIGWPDTISAREVERALALPPRATYTPPPLPPPPTKGVSTNGFGTCAPDNHGSWDESEWAQLEQLALDRGHIVTDIHPPDRPDHTKRRALPPPA